MGPFVACKLYPSKVRIGNRATGKSVLERRHWKVGTGAFLSLYWFIHKSNPLMYYWSTTGEQTTDKTSWTATHCKTFPLCPQEAQISACQVWTGFQSLLQSQIQMYVIPRRTAFLGSQHQPGYVWGSLWASGPKDCRMIWTWIEKGRVISFHILEAWSFSSPFVPALGNTHHSQTAFACFFSPFFFILERSYIKS